MTPSDWAAVTICLSAVMKVSCRGQKFPKEKGNMNIVEAEFEVVVLHSAGDIRETNRYTT